MRKLILLLMIGVLILPQIKSSPKNYKPITTSKFYGLNVDNELELKQGEFFDMENWRITPDYKIEKREGYKEYTFDNSDFPNITKYFVSTDKQYCKLGSDTKKYLYAYGYEDTILYGYKKYFIKVDVETNKILSATLLMNVANLQPDNSLIIVKNGYMYFSIAPTGNTLINRFDGSHIVEVIPTVPILYKSAKPNRSDWDTKKYQPINILTDYRQIEYLADGTVYYYLEYYDSWTVSKVTVNGVTTTAYTMYANDVLQFNVAPASGAIVVIKYLKLNSNQIDLIYNCTNSMFFGGVSDLDLFVWGNPNYPNTVYHSYAGDVKFFSNTGFRTFGDETITDVVVQNTTQLIFGENTIFYTLVSTTEDAANPIAYGKDVLIRQKGHKNWNVRANVQIVNNNPVFIAPDGTINELYIMGTRDERQIRFLSDRDMSSLLRSTDTITRSILSTFDFETKKEYWIFYDETENGATTNKALIFNYYNKTWYKMSGLTACYCPILISNKLYMFGTKYSYFSPEMIADTYLESDIEYQKPIEAFALTPYMSFGADYLLKSIQKLFITLSNNPTNDSFLRVEYWTSENQIPQYAEFSLTAGDPPKEIFQEIGANDFTYMKIKFISDRINETATIINYTVKIQYAGEVS